MNISVKQILSWVPRIFGILFVLFLSLFAMDIFSMNLGFWGTIVGLLMHLIPSIVLAIAVALAWRWEWVGALIFLGWAVYYIFLASGRNMSASSYVLIAGIPALVGLAYLSSWVLKKQNPAS